MAHPVGHLAIAVPRGIAVAAGTGGVLGGAAGTVAWPVVGTFFGGMVGAVIGVMFGVLAAVLLTLVGRARSTWLIRGTSGLVFGLGAVVPALVDRSLALALPAAIGALVGAGFGPAIAYGFTERSRGLLDRSATVLAWSVGGGAVLGGIAGLIIGARVYLPTTPVAAFEGAAFGAVSGGVLGLAGIGAALLLSSASGPVPGERQAR